MDFKTSMAQVAAGQIAPVYTLVGQERYLRDRFEDQLMDQVLKGQVNDFNLTRLDMEEVPLADAMIEANTVSFFPEPRIVWLNNCYFLTGEKVKGGPDHQVDGLLAYLDQPAPDVVLVLSAPYEKLDQRKKITKALKQQAQMVDLGLVPAKQVPAYIQQVAKQAGWQISQPALKDLLDRTRYQLSLALSELDKLALYVGPGQEIDQTAVDQLVATANLDTDIFKLIDFIMQGQPTQALNLYRDLIARKETALGILALLESNFRLYCQVSQLQSLGYDQGTMAKTIGGHPYRIKMASQQIRAYPKEGLMRAYMQLIELDYRIKKGRVGDHLGIEWFILKFCSMSR
ncbi:hypothetical protein AWM75_02835 [Aerococcus urinaehominis]|uniref:DNA polymerase III subunit delta n=1 Tax=Aerococcus urinaehominis TaxID=128944 RepID=A0A0X8FKN9_9LACT|nr:DNA polymerase III subunit delta [Aerococcus urinaehominis]AMB98997.1 hypothetical protein AWM75_02835 [Aerococcus urinaehominis]SDM62169.1 DNA polymerase III, delta subunit [Aerococcus urinaehominis]